MGKHLEKHSGTLLPILISCMFLLLMTLSAFQTSTATDAVPTETQQAALLLEHQQTLDAPPLLAAPQTDVDLNGEPVAWMLDEPVIDTHLTRETASTSELSL